MGLFTIVLAYAIANGLVSATSFLNNLKDGSFHLVSCQFKVAFKRFLSTSVKKIAEDYLRKVFYNLDLKPFESYIAKSIL